MCSMTWQIPASASVSSTLPTLTSAVKEDDLGVVVFFEEDVHSVFEFELSRLFTPDLPVLGMKQILLIFQRNLLVSAGIFIIRKWERKVKCWRFFSSGTDRPTGI